MNLPLSHRVSVAEFLDWAASQAKGRYELVDGMVLAMAPERALHNLVKLAVARSLQDAVAKADLPCTVFGDGMTVVIDDHTGREPDALVQRAKPVDLNSLVADQPLIVVEVVSPSSERADSTEKLVEYFSVPDIQHYLVVVPERRVVVHHRKTGKGNIETKVVASGEISLVPPGIAISVGSIFASIPS